MGLYKEGRILELRCNKLRSSIFCSLNLLFKKATETAHNCAARSSPFFLVLQFGFGWGPRGRAALAGKAYEC